MLNVLSEFRNESDNSFDAVLCSVHYVPKAGWSVAYNRIPFDDFAITFEDMQEYIGLYLDLLSETVEGLLESRPELWAMGGSMGQNGYDYLKEITDSKTAVAFNSFTTGENVRYDDIFSITTRKTVSMAQNADLFFDDVEHFYSRNYSVIILSANSISANNLKDALISRGIKAHLSKPDDEEVSGSVAVVSVETVNLLSATKGK